MLLKMYQDEFHRTGVDLVTAPDGKQGIIEAASQKPDFILLDIMMDGMDGVTAFQHFKSLPETKDIPVAILTVVPEGVPESLNKNQDLFKEAVGYWSKDKYTPIQIGEMIKEHLHQKTYSNNL